MNRWEEDDTFLSRWLSDSLTPEEKADFEASEAGKEWVAMMQAADRIKAPAYDAVGALGQLKERIATAPKPKAKVIWMQPVFMAAAAAAIALVIVVTYLLQSSGITVTTGFNEHEIAFLPDGSEIRLNASSSISYDPDKWDKERRVQLEGEAFFNVKKGSDFSVEAPGGIVKVLGTSFNVKDRAGALDVTCYTGKVKVVGTNTDEDLTPGMTVRLEKGRLIRSQKKKLKKKPSWISGITVLDNVPLKEALHELETIFGISVQYDHKLDTITYDGAFPTKNANSAIKLVLEPLKIRYQYDSAKKSLLIEGID